MDSATAKACAIDDTKENTLDVTPVRQTKFVSRASPRTKEIAALLSMPSDVDQYSFFMKCASAQSEAQVSHEGARSSERKRSVSTLLEAAQLVNEDVEISKKPKLDACDVCDEEPPDEEPTDEEPSTHYTRMFSKAHDAKNACISSDTAIGVGQERKRDQVFFYVYYALETHFKISEIQTEWLYLKARSNRDGDFHLVKLKNAPCSTYKRGIVRLSYSLDNGMFLKIYHYSCKTLDSSEPCRNCKHDKWNSRCLRGMENIVLSFK